MYVLDDGGEADLDLGNYERYLDITLTREHNLTTGKVYSQVIQKERKGDYLGKTVQVIPHVTDAIQEWIERVSKIPVDEDGGTPDVCIVEVRTRSPDTPRRDSDMGRFSLAELSVISRVRPSWKHYGNFRSVASLSRRLQAISC